MKEYLNDTARHFLGRVVSTRTGAVQVSLSVLMVLPRICHGDILSQWPGFAKAGGRFPRELQ